KSTGTGVPASCRLRHESVKSAEARVRLPEDRRAADERPPYLDVAVEDDDVRRRPWDEPPEVRSPRRAGRDARRRLDRALEGSAQPDETPNRVRHRQHAACELAACAAYLAPAHVDLDRADAPAPVARGPDRVGDEDDPAGGGPPRELGRLVGDVVPVEDQLHGHVVADERGRGDAWVAVPERP